MNHRATKSAQVELLQQQLDLMTTQNSSLGQENAILKHKLQQLAQTTKSSTTLNVEAKLKAFQMEDERDHMYENLEKLKKKYNKLHDAYLEKVKRCKALEEMFTRQKTLTGLVMKSAIEQRQNEQKLALEKRLSEKADQTVAESLELKVTKLQAKVEEAYDIIDELEFELESIDCLEIENQRMRTELAELKKKIDNTDQEGKDTFGHIVPPLRFGVKNDDAIQRNKQRHMVASSMCDSCIGDDDFDSDTLERSVLTNSFLEDVEAESNNLRRELLKSRLLNTLRPQKDQKDDRNF